MKRTKGSHPKWWGRLVSAACWILFPVQGAAQTDLPTVAEAYYSHDSRLQTLIQEAIENNPSLMESRARYRAALQRVPQVSSLPDPLLNYTQFIRSTETRVGPQVNSFTLSQSFPWFGTLDLKAQIALKTALAEYEAHHSRVDDLANRVKQAYFEISYLDQSLSITAEEQALLEHYEQLAQNRYSSGQGLQQAIIRIQAEMTRLVDRARRLRLQRDSASARLDTLSDRRPGAPIGLVGTIPLPEIRLDLEELYTLSEANRPELRARRARVEKSEQEISLAKKDFWPQFTAGFGYTNVGERGDPAGRLLPPPDNGKDAYMLSFGIKLPLWRDKYRAGVMEATESVIAERKGYLSQRNEIEFSIRDQSLRLESLKEQIDLLDRVLLPQAEEALFSTESAYETGQVGSLDLLDGERFLLQVKLMRARYATDFLQALSHLERAIGSRFPQ